MSKKTVLAVAFTSLLIALMLISQAKAEISKPSVPEFSAEYVDNSYDITPTYTIDPYTNTTVIQTYGRHVDNRTVIITIINEPFTPFNDSYGNTIDMFYNVRYRGSFGQNWTEVYGVERIVVYNFDNPDDYYGYKIQNYVSQNTVVATKSPAKQGQMDIQVEALQGYTGRTQIRGSVVNAVIVYDFHGEESGWSNTETVMIGAASTYAPTPSSSPSPLPSPTTELTLTPKQTDFLGTNLPTEYGYAIVAVLAAVVAAICILTSYKRTKKAPG